MIAIMIGVIITVRITTPTRMPSPLRLITPATEALELSETRTLSMKGTSTRIPISP